MLDLLDEYTHQAGTATGEEEGPDQPDWAEWFPMLSAEVIEQGTQEGTLQEQYEALATSSRQAFDEAFAVEEKKEEVTSAVDFSRRRHRRRDHRRS